MQVICFLYDEMLNVLCLVSHSKNNLHSYALRGNFLAFHVKTETLGSCMQVIFHSFIITELLVTKTCLTSSASL